MPSKVADVKAQSAAERADATDIDRAAIRKSRAQEAKRAKRLVRDRFNEVIAARPFGSRPADKILSHAADLYRDGPIEPRALKASIARLEATIRSDLPDLVIQRAPRTASPKPKKVGLIVYETRAIVEEGQRFITAENHSVVLTERSIVFISGLLPGGSRTHLFERVFERGGRSRMLAEIQLQLSALWPTLLWMRTQQRLQGRGKPLAVMMTPFEDGLLFGSLQKVDALPAAGPTVVVVRIGGQETRTLRDFYGDEKGTRLWAMTNTFVDEALLNVDQRPLLSTLVAYVREYPDVIADNDWRWRIGLGIDDPAVHFVANTFRITTPSESRRSEALGALEEIVNSGPWQREAARSLKSQEERRCKHEA